MRNGTPFVGGALSKLQKFIDELAADWCDSDRGSPDPGLRVRRFIRAAIY